MVLPRPDYLSLQEDTCPVPTPLNQGENRGDNASRSSSSSSSSSDSSSSATIEYCYLRLIARQFKELLIMVDTCQADTLFSQEAKSKLLEAAKLHVHIGLNTYLGKINTHVSTSSYELSTLNSASNVILEVNWVSHR
ncbi:hypothetical protein Tco_1082367 [Tanacetum coccineum]|uniref:Uncharacterized protein n=1 Tax=Tanacetum coccineum TaxID=301880 RepID=A0ABQ5I1W3_9ASTR